MTNETENVEPQSDKDPIITVSDDGKMRVSSRDVAENFGKSHDKVVRDIESLDCSPEFRSANFGETPYIHPQNKQTYKMYEMTRDGWAFLVMGFTGAKAAKWKEKYIAAFNAMDAALQKKASAPDLSNPAHLRHLLLDYSEKVMALESQIEEDKPKLEALDRISEADGSLCITDAAKALQMRPKDLFSYLKESGWTYKRPGNAHWLGYQSKVTTGLLEHKVTTVLKADGSEKITEQVRITPKGLSKLAILIRPAFDQRAVG